MQMMQNVKREFLNMKSASHAYSMEDTFVLITIHARLQRLLSISLSAQGP